MEMEKIPPHLKAITGVDHSPMVNREPLGHKQGQRPEISSRQAGKQAPNPREIKVVVEGGDFARLEKDKTRFQELAQSIRKSDQALEAIDDYLGKMQSLVEGFVKQYPPFPPESRQQLDLVKQFNALWRLVKKLEIPPEKDVIETGPIPEGRRQDHVLKAEDCRDPARWLGIDPLPRQIPDGRLEQSLEAVKNARGKVAESRRVLSEKAAAIASGI